MEKILRTRSLETCRAWWVQTHDTAQLTEPRGIVTHSLPSSLSCQVPSRSFGLVQLFSVSTAGCLWLLSLEFLHKFPTSYAPSSPVLPECPSKPTMNQSPGFPTFTHGLTSLQAQLLLHLVFTPTLALVLYFSQNSRFPKYVAIHYYRDENKELHSATLIASPHSFSLTWQCWLRRSSTPSNHAQQLFYQLSILFPTVSTPLLQSTKCWPLLAWCNFLSASALLPYHHIEHLFTLEWRRV